MKIKAICIGPPLLVLFMLPALQGRAQFFKNILNTVKQTAQNRANSKASQTTNSAIDHVENAGKPNSSGNSNSNTQPNAQPATPSTGVASPTSGTATTPGIKTNQPGNQDSDSSYLTLSLSAYQILSGGGVTISGNSIRFQNMKDVSITIDGNDAHITKTLPMDDSGHFKTVQIFSDDGEYQITVSSSNRKSTKTATLDVYKLENMDSVTEKNKVELTRAYDLLNTWIVKIKGQLASQDAQQLQKPFDDLTDKKNKTLTIYQDLDALGRSLAKLQKAEMGSGGGGSGGNQGNASGPGNGTGNVSGNGGGNGSQNGNGENPYTEDLTQITDALSNQATQMKSLNDMASHKPYDNTICEYMEMVSEACNAFSTVATLFSGKGELKLGITDIGANLAKDKGIPFGFKAANEKAGINGTPSDLILESAKMSTTTLTDIESLSSSFTKAGFAGDIVSICSNYFMKKYCGTMSGNMSEDYTCTFMNKHQVTWWEYSYHNEATVKLRYLKSATTPTLIKMKGNIEGNATKFSIYQKVSQMDAFKEAMKNRAQVFSICLYVPPTMPAATSQADKKTDFGAVARGIITPAYFNIPIDADYNPQTGEMKIFCNEAIVDYAPTVQYIYGYIIIAAMIPLTARVNFPINKAKLTIAKVIEKNNDFKMVMGADKNMSFSKTASFEMGKGTDIGHHISMNISAKSD